MGAPGVLEGSGAGGWAGAGKGAPLCATPPSPAIRRSSRLWSFFSLDINAQLLGQCAILTGGAALGRVAGNRLAEHLALAQLGVDLDFGLQHRAREGGIQLLQHGAVHPVAAAPSAPPNVVTSGRVASVPQRSGQTTPSGRTLRGKIFALGG